MPATPFTIPTPPHDLPRTLGDLRASGGSRSRSPRSSAATRRPGSAAGEPLVTGVLGFEDTVLPQLENALLAGHDVILLGERGQAKTRLIRSMVELLDEWLPVIAGSEINDDPYLPTSRFARVKVAEEGDETPIAWLHRSDRYGEKLATPDTSIADLIGEVDPIKVAEGRYLSDELALHYGLVPRVNRGIFAINELPDLAERIQVGLLNVLEERDVQIRGHRIRLPLDVMLVATANPEDYTNRGPDHHPAEGPLRGADPHPLPARHPDRDGRHALGGRAAPARPAGDGARRTSRRWWPRSASWPGAAHTSTSAAACRCASPSPTTRPWWPTPCAGRCGPGSRWPCPG